MLHAGALGIPYPIKVPYVGTVTIDIPVEQAVQDMVNAAIPQLEAQMPRLTAAAVTSIQPLLEQKIPPIVTKAMDQVQTQLEQRLPTLLPTLVADAQAYVPQLTQQAWSAVEPQVTQSAAKLVFVTALATSAVTLGGVWMLAKAGKLR